MNQFSDFKAAWHLDRIKDLRDGKDIVPTHVQLILSDLCNQNCHFCSYRMDGGFSTENFADEKGNKNPNRRIPTEKAIEILDDCARLGVKAIEFTGGGEPTVHPDWEMVIGHAQKLGLETGLVTNGVRLKPCNALDNLDWLRISVDAGTEATYERMRESKAWKQVMQNLDMTRYLTKPFVGMGFVITRENYFVDELVGACEIAKNAGMDYIRLSAMFSTTGADYYAGIDDQIDAARGIAKTLETDKFKVIDFFGNRIADLKQQAPDYSFCGKQQFVLYIGGDQKIYRCCTTSYTKHGEIGDLREQTFADWINQYRRYDFDARSCRVCQFNIMNVGVNYLLDKAPAHVNFV